MITQTSPRLTKMEQPPTIHTPSIHLTFALYTLVVLFRIAAHLTFGDVYDILFKTLSGISVCMVIFINYPKAKERYLKLKQQWKKKKRK